jgi:hypothetical protein
VNYPFPPVCRECGCRVRIVPGLRARIVVCIGPGHCDPCCAECGTELALDRDGQGDVYYGDCDHLPAVRRDQVERPQMPPRRSW